MQIQFWGVRGSISVSGTSYLRTGGNTSCVEVLHRGSRLILDGGTGLRALGESVGREAIEATVLFSHVHWDHIQGVPFFIPAYHSGSKLTLAGAARKGGTLRDALNAQMRPPTFPVTLEALRAQLDFVHVEPGQAFQSGPFRILPVELTHPNGVLAYRIEADGQSIVYATDVEHGGSIDPRLLELAEGADLLIHDAQYTCDEYSGACGPCRKGWGHSTWREAVEAAERASVRRLALFHHDPERDDDALAIIEDQARRQFAGAFAAREGERTLL